MGIEVTDEAAEVLRRSMELSGVSPESGGIRLRATRGLGGGQEIQVELAEGARPGETVVETSEVRLFVDPEVLRSIPDAILVVEPQHEVVVVRPAEPPS